MSRKLFLLDGSALIYRAFHALSRMGLRNRAGEPTGAVFGFANTLHALVRQERPDYIAVVFDAPGPTFRHQRYTEYKANRAKTPDELRAQFPRVRELVAAWPCASIEVEGVEADDVIGSYTRQLAGPDLEVVAVTGDKDFYQLLGEHVRILNPGRGGAAAVEPTLIGPDQIPAKFGVTEPDQVVDVLALMGDTSDNVPGIPGIGPKTAGTLIAEHGSVEALFERLETLKPALRRKLEGKKAIALLAKELITIRTDLDLPVSLDAMETVPPGGDALVKILRDLDFQRMLADLGVSRKEVAEPLSLFTRHTQYRLIETVDALRELVAALRTRERLALTVVADGDPLHATVVGLALSADPEDAAYVPVAHTAGPSLGADRVREVLGPLLAEPGPAWTLHDAKLAHHQLKSDGFPVPRVTFDTALASYLVDPESRHTLETVVRDRLGETMLGWAELVGKGAKRIAAAATDPAETVRYAGEAADMTGRLRADLTGRLESIGLAELFHEVEMPLAEVLGAMEQAGVAVDVPYLQAMSERMATRMGELTRSAHALAETEFNINSPSQLAQVLFERLALPPGKKTKTGFSTDSEVLEALRDEHELPGVVLEYRQLSKLKSTYVDALPALVDPETGRIHCRFNQTVAATGRLSSSDPNLQNIPIRTPLGREVRRAFVVGRQDWVLVSADYSQIELRIMAHLSGDPVLVHAFANGIDVHRDTAARIFGVEPEAVTDLQRGQAKTVNFAVLYGQGPFGLARTLGIANKEAQAFIRNYKAQYAGVVGYLDSTLEQARAQGYVTTLLKRRRYLPALRQRGSAARAAAERLAINTPIQGTAADLIKVAMVNVHRRLAREGLAARLLLTVHDELVLESPVGEAEAVERLVTEEMAGAIELSVPVIVNTGVGENWEAIH